ncbi:MAG: hypothetical protein JWO82_4116 [Akkermansiaceae bacterium]|nr:hypothetical protein [Akkermansiaceae bacterium]
MKAELTPAEVDRITSLLSRIQAAFHGVPRPQITRSVAEGLDDEWTLSEERFRELNARDPEQEWTDLTGRDLEESNGYFTFADDEGWRFYLPAHMSMVLGDFHTHSSGSSVYNACTDPKPRFGALDEAQMACVLEFTALIHGYWARTMNQWKQR